MNVNMTKKDWFVFLLEASLYIGTLYLNPIIVLALTLAVVFNMGLYWWLGAFNLRQMNEYLLKNYIGRNPNVAWFSFFVSLVMAFYVFIFIIAWLKKFF